jgi:hypothetical protein
MQFIPLQAHTCSLSETVVGIVLTVCSEDLMSAVAYKHPVRVVIHREEAKRDDVAYLTPYCGPIPPRKGVEPQSGGAGAEEKLVKILKLSSGPEKLNN